MKKLLRHVWLFATLALLLGATTAIAQNPPEPPAPPRSPDAELEDAQARLEQAAREIAELTARMVGEAGAGALARLEEAGRRSRPVMLGINIGLVGGPEAREEGVQVLGVTPGSAAEEAGIRSGDVLLEIGAARLDWSGDTTPVNKLLEALREVEPGTEVSVTYRRDGGTATAAVEARPWTWRGGFPFDAERFAQSLPSREQFSARRFMVQSWGDMELVRLTPGLGEYFQVGEGVLVVRAPADPALGLRDGDVIVDIAGRKPADPGHVVRILRSYAPGERLVMSIVRKGRRQQLEADIPG
jgi:membrane-associated protease RseP (regulator of RpoE activity)